jgi:hypothetical protein
MNVTLVELMDARHPPEHWAKLDAERVRRLYLMYATRWVAGWGHRIAGGSSLMHLIPICCPPLVAALSVRASSDDPLSPLHRTAESPPLDR